LLKDFRIKLSNKYWLGKTASLPTDKIFLQVKHLEKGNYELNIIYNNKIILTANFEIN